jgi:hypothetical protein
MGLAIAEGRACAKLLARWLVLGAAMLAGGSVAAEETAKPLVDVICPLMEEQAKLHALPPYFFVRLIWRESRFRPGAVSPKGAQGIAQFMPGTAADRGLDDPFDPVSAITHSASLLADLKTEFGNLGLAAAAYNAGPERVRGWLSGARTLPAETRNYVRFITGLAADDWTLPKTKMPEEVMAEAASLQESCRKLAPRVVLALNPKGDPVEGGTWRPWGVQLAANFSKSQVVAAYDRLKQKHAAVLAEAEPMFVPQRNRSRGRKAMIALRIGADSREEAQTLCNRLRSKGGYCLVQKN